MRRLAALCGAVLALSPPAARADELRVDLRVDVPVTAVAAVGWVVSEAFASSLAPAACRWCAANGLDDGLRSSLRWSDTGLANTLSNVSGFAVAPLLAFGLPPLLAAREGRLGGAPADLLVIAEAASLTAAVDQIVKFSTGRQRPYARAGASAGARSSEDDLSFFSGHTSLGFALAVSSGTVASLRGYGGAPAVWAAGLLTAATTGYLRIAADRHYFSDVAVGALVGSAFGLAVPWLHRREGPRLTVAPLEGGALVLLRL